MPPGDFWGMTLSQLMTLADEHQAAHQTGGRRETEPADGASLLGFAAMHRK
ncbi:hypothetical protein ACSCBZ_24840 [Streptomyces niveiscabiei]|uniref:hypothetical protein n=1 Tax=Streptomyces niveiscabiei TaxID=164115 RepID=UPI003B8A6B0E